MELEELVSNIRSARDEANAALNDMEAERDHPDTESLQKAQIGLRFAAANAVVIALSRILGEEPPKGPNS